MNTVHNKDHVWQCHLCDYRVRGRELWFKYHLITKHNDTSRGLVEMLVTYLHVFCSAAYPNVYLELLILIMTISNHFSSASDVSIAITRRQRNKMLQDIRESGMKLL